MRWSYSAWSCYSGCPAKYKYRYIERHSVPKIPSPAMERGTEIHSLFEASLTDAEAELPPPFDYYTDFLEVLRNHGTKPEQTIILESDWTPAPPWNEGWVKAILDAGLVKGTEARNYDWKTGKIYDEHQDQRELYSLMQFCANPEVLVVVGMHVYVDKKENRSTIFQRSQVPDLKAKWEERARMMNEDEIFPTNPSFSCRFCDFSKYSGGPCRF